MVAKNLFSTAISPPAADRIVLHRGVPRKACLRDCMVKIIGPTCYQKVGYFNGGM